MTATYPAAVDLRALTFELAGPVPESVHVEAAVRLDEDQRDRLLRYADTQAVLLAVARWLVDAGRVPSRSRERLARATDGRAERVVLAQELEIALEEGGLTAAFIKGVATEALYPPGYLRQFGDVDLAVPDLDVLWVIAEGLMEQRWPEPELALRRDPVGGIWSGEAVFRRPSEAEPEEGLGLEIQIAAQPIHRASAIPFEDALWRTTTRANGLTVPAPRWAWRILLGELAGRPRLHLRDLWDASAISRHCNADDRDWVLRQCDHHALGFVSERVERALDGRRTVVTRLRELWATGLPFVWSSLMLATRHTYPLVRARQGRTAGVLTAGACVGLDVLRGHPIPVPQRSAAWWLEHGFLLRLLLDDPTARGSFRVSVTGGRVRIRCPLGTYQGTLLR
jgi:hypothetical protein